MYYNNNIFIIDYCKYFFQIVQESEERLSEDDVSKIIDIVNEHFPANP